MKYKLNTFFIGLAIILYVIEIIVLKFYKFKTGILDLTILSIFFVSFSIKLPEFVSVCRRLLKNRVTILFGLFSLYFIYLSLSSFNRISLIVLEYFSIIKVVIYFLIGYVFSELYLPRNEYFPNKKTMLIIALLVFSYGLVDYNWGGVNLSISNLFGFYINRGSSIFILPSILSLFGLILFFYGVNVYSRDRKLGLILVFFALTMIFMSGSRKTLVGIGLFFILYKPVKYVKLLRISKLFLIPLILIFFTHTTLFSDSIEEYSNEGQPRNYAMLMSFIVAKDYFPIGSGPGTLFSRASYENYSPVYYEYGIDKKWGFGPNDPIQFYNDTFWAQVIAQYGFIGTILYLLMIISIIRALKKCNYEFPLHYSHLVIILLILSITTPTLQRTEIAFFVFLPAGILCQRNLVL